MITVMPSKHTLSDIDHQILAFEQQWWKFPGAKEQAIRETFGLSATAFYQHLNVLMDESAAAEEFPLLVKRLHRLREERRRIRAAAQLEDFQ